MRLQRLTGLEQQKIHDEIVEIKKEIVQFESILGDHVILNKELETELVEIKTTYGDARRTRIEAATDILTEADLIPDEDVVVTLTLKGYIKRVSLALYDVQHRGGKGKMGMAALEDMMWCKIFLLQKIMIRCSSLPHLDVCIVCKALKCRKLPVWRKGVQL